MLSNTLRVQGGALAPVLTQSGAAGGTLRGAEDPEGDLDPPAIGEMGFAKSSRLQHRVLELPAAPRGLAEGDKAEAGWLLSTPFQVLPVHRAPTVITVSQRNLSFLGVTVKE